MPGWCHHLSDSDTPEVRKGALSQSSREERKSTEPQRWPPFYDQAATTGLLVPSTAGDVRQISRLVDEAEKLPWPDKKELGCGSPAERGGEGLFFFGGAVRQEKVMGGDGS